MFTSCQFNSLLQCRKKMKAANLFLVNLILILFLSSCDLPEETTESGDNVNLGYAIAFKARECGNYPNYPLYIAKGSAMPAKKDVQVCSLTIIQQPCPFKDYPYYCLKLFKNYGIKTPLSKKEK
jgi:hypothetical protein